MVSAAVVVFIVAVLAGAGAASDYSPNISSPSVISTTVPNNFQLPDVRFNIWNEDVTNNEFNWEYPAGSYDIPGLSVPSIHDVNNGMYAVVKSTVKSTTLPLSYDLRKHGFVTPVKKQGMFATCWAFAIINSIESNILKQGYVPSPYDLDLSELQLAYFMYNRDGVTTGTALPELAGLQGDDIRSDNWENYLDNGGNILTSSFHLMTGIGVVNEVDVPYSIASVDLHLDPSYAVDKNAYVVSDAIFVSKKDRSDIKQLIMEKGAGVVSYKDIDPNLGYYHTTSLYGTNYYQEIYDYTDHSVSIVGWDDNYPRESFFLTPPHNGAWLIKNSWGTGFGDNGYFWISYDDPSLSDVVFYDVRPASKSDTIYQYDGTGSINGYVFYLDDDINELRYDSTISNEFTAIKNEVITDISFATFNPCVTYDIQILVEGDSGNEDDIVLAAQEVGYVPYSGYHTIHLKTPVTVKSGKAFAVLLYMEAPKGSSNIFGNNGLVVPFDESGHCGPAYMISAYEEGVGYWVDFELDGAVPGGNFRIKALSVSEKPNPIPTPSWAGSGTAASPYQIRTAEDLQTLSYLVNLGESYEGKYFKQMDDISLAGLNWDPIGYFGEYVSHPFSGTFDGNGYTISNLFIDRPDENSAGLFGMTQNAVISNVNLESVNINGRGSVGSLIGFSSTTSSSKIINCHSSGSVNGYTAVGGLIGINYIVENAVCTVDNCSSSCSVTGIVFNIGGLIGSNEVYSGINTITNSYATGDVSSDGNQVGGLLGLNYAKLNGVVYVENCSSTGIVSGLDAVGGLIGYQQAYNTSEISLQNCSSSSQVTGYNSTGGLVGANIPYENSKHKITSCFSTGSVVGDGNWVGGLIGRNHIYAGNCLIANSYATGDVSSIGDSVGGLLGNNYVDVNSLSSVENCYAFGNVDGRSLVGGIAGVNYDVASTSNAIITNCVAMNSELVGTSDAGRIIGSNNDGAVNNNYALSTMNWRSIDSNDYAVMGNDVDLESLKTEAFYTTNLGWDFSKVWKMGVYPILRNSSGIVPQAESEKPFTGTLIDEPVVIGEYVYNGLEQTVQITVDECNYSIVGGTQTAIAKGTYSVEVELKDKENTAWRGEGHGTDNLNLEWTINPKSVEGVVVTISPESKKYTGEVVETTTIVCDGDDVLETNDYEVSGDIANATGGDHIITVVGKNNYTGTIDATWTLEKAVPTLENISVGTSDIIYYDGMAHNIEGFGPREGVYGLGEITVLYNDSVVEPIQPGFYIVNVSIAEGVNYTAAKLETGVSLTILYPEPVEPTLPITDIVIDGDNVQITVSGSGATLSEDGLTATIQGNDRVCMNITFTTPQTNANILQGTVTNVLVNYPETLATSAESVGGTVNYLMSLDLGTKVTDLLPTISVALDSNAEAAAKAANPNFALAAMISATGNADEINANLTKDGIKIVFTVPISWYKSMPGGVKAFHWDGTTFDTNVMVNTLIDENRGIVYVAITGSTFSSYGIVGDKTAPYVPSSGGGGGGHSGSSTWATATPTPAQPTDTQPTDAQPTDAQPTDTQPTETAPTVQPTSAQPTKPAGSPAPIAGLILGGLAAAAVLRRK